MREEPKKIAASAPTRKTPARYEKDRKREEAERRQQRSRRLKPLQGKLQRLEEKIAAAEARQREVEADLGSAQTCQSLARARSLSFEYKELTTNLAYLYDEWAKLQEELDALA